MCIECWTMHGHLAGCPYDDEDDGADAEELQAIKADADYEKWRDDR